MIDRSIYKQAYKLLQELEADPISVLRKAAEIYKLSVDGYPEETISPATGEIVTLNRVNPAIGIQALQVTNATVKRLHEELEKDDNQGTTEDRQLVINLSELKVNRE